MGLIFVSGNGVIVLGKTKIHHAKTAKASVCSFGEKWMQGWVGIDDVVGGGQLGWWHWRNGGGKSYVVFGFDFDDHGLILGEGGKGISLI